MLINKVREDGDGGEGTGESALDYRTASELFDLMTRNASFDCDNNSLSAQDLVLLYQNMDLGTQLMHDANELAVRKPNQYVETVVYNDLEDLASDSDSEMYTNTEIHDVFAVNQERLDFINNISIENLLCHKLGGVAIHTSDIGFDYDKKCFFQDPYIKNQLKNFNVLNNPSDTDLFSTSLIEYICCKRMEDNYNFYMDNIIRYVQHTIDQLKRISNGDYLTDRAKEKWREVISSDLGQDKDMGTKVLAMSTSIPLHVECKAAGKATWDELVHSEVDVRSLSKILEKKIIVEIPKLLCGSYRLYSKRFEDNLIISCKKEEQENSEDSRVDVVLKLERSQTGDVISNISSIMVLKTVPALSDLRSHEILPLPSSEQSEEKNTSDPNEAAVTVIKVIKTPVPVIPELENEDAVVEEITAEVDEHEGSYAGTNDYPISEKNASCASIRCSSESSILAKESEKPNFPTDSGKTTLKSIQDNNIYNIISPRELQMTMHKLNMRQSTLEENAEDTNSQSTSKRRSPIRVRIKSPYENKSFSIEEKKRKKLLEIRERREKKKLALSENCKIVKHKYAKGGAMPQASSSVTKLSITNRSFYNSIYGQNTPTECKPKPRKSRNIPDVSCMDETNEDCLESPMVSPDKNSKKYIDRSYYLDEAETEVTYMQKMNSDDVQSPHSTTNSIVSTDFGEHLELFKQLIPSETNLTGGLALLNESKIRTSADGEVKPLMPIEECENKTINVTQQSNEKPSGVECRRSIDQLYDLMKQMGKQINSAEGDKTSSKVMDSNNLSSPGSIHGSESGSSVKHSPRANTASAKSRSIKHQTPVAPKSAMASKQSPKAETDKGKKERKRVVISPIKGPFPENPLKAISQLLQEFEKVQNKSKHYDGKHPKKTEIVTTDTKSYSRPGNYRRQSRLDQHSNNEQLRKPSQGQNVHPRDKKARPGPPESAREYHHIEDRNFDKMPRKKIADIIDEAKEARGEAVRGPPKFPSRLESLAQPKKCYVQAHVEEYQTRYGRNMMLGRLQKLATHAPAPATHRSSPVSRNRWKNGPELAAGPTVKQRAPSVPLIEQHAPAAPRKRRSASSSPASPQRRATCSPLPRSPPHSPRRRRSPSFDNPSTKGKRTVAVESSSSHFPPAPLEERHRGLTCRVPLLPHDIETASLRLSSGTEESTSLGSTLHQIFESVVSPGLAALTECSESLAPSEAPRSDSDYCVNVLEDGCITTAVGLCTDFTSESFHPHHNSSTEIEKLENALYSHISGSFQKRLRIKNLTLTPKTSMQHVFLLQSGDAGSVLVKSVSNVKLDRRSAKSLHEFKPMPVLSNTHIDWRFTQIPMHIATVGYAFVQKQSRSASGSRVQLIEPPIVETREHSVQQTCQSSQCFRGVSQNPFKDASAQADVANNFTSQATVDNHSANNCEAKNKKESMVNTETFIDATFPVNETSNEDKANESETGTKEVETELSNEFSNTVPAAPTTTFVAPEYTTSLDMLVGLLNEIQKITCQNQITPTEHTSKTDQVPTRTTTVSRLEAPRNIVSLTSLDHLCQLQSNASIFTYYISNNDTTTSSNKADSVVELEKALKLSDVSVEGPKSVMKEHVTVEVRNPTGVDKEVSANICSDCVGICTSVPSSLHAVLCDNICSAGVLVPSVQSVASLRAYHSCTNNAFRAPSIKKIIELPQIEATPLHALIARDNKDLNDKRLTSFAPIRKIENVKTDKSLKTRCEIGKYRVANFDVDPMFKFKRDILVSVYSILVLTVFAALSFPELLMFQS